MYFQPFFLSIRHLTKIFLEAYDVLYTYLMGDSRKNELYIAKYIDFFLTQFEYKEVSTSDYRLHEFWQTKL